MTIWQLLIMYILPLVIYIMLDVRLERPRLNKLIDAAMMLATVAFVYLGGLWGFESNVVAVLFVIVFWQLRYITKKEDK